MNSKIPIRLKALPISFNISMKYSPSLWYVNGIYFFRGTFETNVNVSAAQIMANGFPPNNTFQHATTGGVIKEFYTDASGNLRCRQSLSSTDIFYMNEPMFYA